MNILKWESQIKKAVNLYGRKMFGSDKQDLTQNCYVAILRASDKVTQVEQDRGEDAAKGYVFVMCRNELLSSQRPLRNVHLVPFFDTGAAAQKPNEKLRDAIECLKPEEQELLYDVYYQGYSVSQLAKAANVPIGRLQYHKQRILKELKKICQ